MIEIILLILSAVFGLGYILLFIKDSRVRFISVFAVLILLGLKSEHGTSSLLDYAAAGLFTGSFLYLIVKRNFIQSRPMLPNPLFIFFSLFLVWGIIVGLLWNFAGEVKFESWYRDTLLFISPMFLLPVLYNEMLEEHQKADHIFRWSILVLWIVVFFATIIKIRSNYMNALYAYEIGMARYDDINGGFMILLFLSLGMITTGKKTLLLLGGLSISALSLFLTFGRTSWIATILLAPSIFFLGDRFERKIGLRFIFRIFIILIPVLVLAFFFIPLFKLVVLMAVNKFFTSANLGTDPSMYNRYVEWRIVIKKILSQPLASYGFGTSFWDYSWITGVSFEFGYSHNMVLAVLLKSGLVGLILLFIPYIGYFIKGIKNVKNKLLTGKERAYLRAAICTLLFTAVMGYTGSVFLQRNMSLYVALFWCFITEIEYKIANRKATLLNRGNALNSLNVFA